MELLILKEVVAVGLCVLKLCNTDDDNKYISAIHAHCVLAPSLKYNENILCFY